MMGRANKLAHARRVDGARLKENATAPVETIEDLTGAIYYLQSLNRDGRYRDRIRALVAEKQRRT